jgi:hypothetical protein
MILQGAGRFCAGSTTGMGAMQGDFTGVAELQPVGEAGLIYTESGQMRIGAAPVMQATRRYLWGF